MKRIEDRDVSVTWESPGGDEFRIHARVKIGRRDEGGLAWDDVEIRDVTTVYGDPVEQPDFFRRPDYDADAAKVRERLVEAAIADRDAEAEDARERAAEEREDAP